MSASLELGGLKELRDALSDMPEQLKAEFGPVVMAHAEGMAADLKATYHKTDGVLADRVVVEPGRTSPLLAKVRTKAPHAHLYEYGTVRRFTKGTGAFRGVMPAQPTFVPAAVRWRDRLVRAAKSTLQAMRVRGFTGSFEVRES